MPPAASVVDDDDESHPETMRTENRMMRALGKSIDERQRTGGRGRMRTFSWNSMDPAMVPDPFHLVLSASIVHTLLSFRRPGLRRQVSRIALEAVQGRREQLISNSRDARSI
jgi:hypothetical protein